MNEQSPPILTAEHEADVEEEVATRSLTGDLKMLAEDARTLAEAELEFQKARSSYAAAQVPRIAVAGLVAFVLLFFAGMALIVGTIIALVPVVGAWGATAIVTGVLLLLAIIFAVIARSRTRELKQVVGKNDRHDEGGSLYEDESTSAFEETDR